MKTSVAEPRPRSVIRCAACSARPCLCIERLHETAARLIARAARGEATAEELDAWSALDQQRRREEREVCRLSRTLRERFGGASYGPSHALRYLVGGPIGWPGFRPGTDEEVHIAMRASGLPARREHVAAARRAIANEWLRVPLRRPSRRKATTPGPRRAAG